MNASVEFTTRLELVRSIAILNTGRTTFARDEQIQFIVAATLFTTAELRTMHESAQAAAWQTPSSKQGA
jgi:hypothetical protein